MDTNKQPYRIPGGVSHSAKSEATEEGFSGAEIKA